MTCDPLRGPTSQANSAFHPSGVGKLHGLHDYMDYGGDGDH